MTTAIQPKSTTSRRHLRLAATAYAALLAIFWIVAEHFSLNSRLGHMPSTFAAFALILAPYWFFGFGLHAFLRQTLALSDPRINTASNGSICGQSLSSVRNDFYLRAARVLAPGLLVIPYVVYSLPRGEFQWMFFTFFFVIPVGICTVFEFLPPGGRAGLQAGFSWQDFFALSAVGVPVEFHWIEHSFPHPGLTSLPKLLMVDAALYAYLVVRRLDHVGYDFRPSARDLLVGLRELAFFAPIVITLGLALHFITPHGGLPSPGSAFSALMITFFFVAIPEELFFRGLLQNLLEPRLGRTGALCVTAVIFGLSHFNKPLPFNWRYVLLATIAGIFYGRAWRDRRRLLASATTHTLVDVLWTLWFR